MPTKIRLQRHGKKRYSFFHVVVADTRAPRDGKYIERLGTYNPNDNPATIDINFDRALYWVKTGAQPTDTCRALLSYKGVIHKNHLDKGVLKGALTQEQADKKFEAWLAEKESKIGGKKDNLAKAAADAEKIRMDVEKAANAKKSAEVLAKNTPPAEEIVETPVDEIPTEAVAEETAPIVEAKEEKPAETKVEETPVAEVKEEAPAKEEKKDEA